MAPDADKERTKEQDDLLHLEYNQMMLTDGISQETEDTVNTKSLEVVYKRVVSDFSYMENPVRCFLIFKSLGKKLSCNGKNAVFLVKPESIVGYEEFALIEEVDGSMLIQNTTNKKFLCSNSKGVVYASENRHEDMEKWEITRAKAGGFHITSVASNRMLTCIGNIIGTQEHKTMDQVWELDLTSGELCYISLAAENVRIRCDMVGNLSTSKNWLGWEAWRFSEAGEGVVRISPWAHSGIFLSCNEQGEVCATEERGESEKWVVEKAHLGYMGVLIRSANTGRILRYQGTEQNCLHTVKELEVDYSSVWELESLHRQTYHIACRDQADRRLEATRKGVVGTRKLPLRISSEEWRIDNKNGDGVVTLYSHGSQKYLGSSSTGEVFLMAEADGKGSEKWVIKERDDGHALVSNMHQRVLVYRKEGCLSTVLPGTSVMGCTRWNLEPKVPRQVNKEKMQAVGAAVAFGVATTVATPFVIGGAIGVIGVSQVGVAGQVAIGSIRAAEALSSIARFTLSSSELLTRQPYVPRSDSTASHDDQAIQNRPFSAWPSW